MIPESKENQRVLVVKQVMSLAYPDDLIAYEDQVKF